MLASLGAMILLNGKVLACDIHSLDDCRAKLHVRGPAFIPEHFAVTIRASGEEHLARVICRKRAGDETWLWIEFLDRPARA